MSKNKVLLILSMAVVVVSLFSFNTDNSQRADTTPRPWTNRTTVADTTPRPWNPTVVTQTDI